MIGDFGQRISQQRDNAIEYAGRDVAMPPHGIKNLVAANTRSADCASSSTENALGSIATSTSSTSSRCPLRSILTVSNAS